MKLLHLTDTHFVPKGETLYGGDPCATLEKAVIDINRHHADADLVVITGDLTHWGEKAAFDCLAATLDPLTPPVRLLVGNHDDRAVFAETFPDQPTDEDGFVQSVHDTEAGRLLFLDTMLEGTHAGWYCAQRRAWLDRQLQAARDDAMPVFLFMHHPPFRIGLSTLDAISLQEADLFWETIEPYANQIRHLFFGHIHRPLSGNWKGISVSALRSMNHQCRLEFEPLEGIPGSFEPPAYAVVLIDGESVIVHTHDFMDQSQKFWLNDSPVKDWAVRYAHP
ncbi:MAG: phosphodiesterase [Alphaproteobacteria bacterium]|nr:phosphodiesterase [Alphaproteobacteria bacterium]